MRRLVLFLAATAALFLVIGRLAASGLIEEDTPIPSPGNAGAPHRALSPLEVEQFKRGRQLFDENFGVARGGGPVLNGDSCRACHVDPVIGGSGGVDLQVQRPAISDGGGGFLSPEETGPLAQTHSMPGVAREEMPETVVFVEERNSPSLLGLGLIQGISEETILGNEDPGDTDMDDIRGVAHMLPGDVVGRFGWKADIPSIESFVRDAFTNEMGITVPDTGNPFGAVADGDGVADPEAQQTEIDDIAFFIRLLDFPPKAAPTVLSETGATVFQSIGCAKCHVPTMDGVELYSNLLLHDVHPVDFQGVTSGQATSGFYRTAPLRGLRFSAPYFHDGRSETLEDAVRRHDGEARMVREAFEALTPTERTALLEFLLSL